MVKKNMAFEEPGAAMGHNKPSEENEFKYAKKWADLELKKIAIADEQKHVLNCAKDEGFLKTPIKRVGKEMISGPEKVAATREVEKQTERLRQYAANKDGQYDFLVSAA